MVTPGRIWGPPRAGARPTPAWPPVLEEALEGPADPVALRRREQVLQLLAEGPPLHTDAGRQDLRHPLQGGERRGWVGGIQRIGVCRAGPQTGEARVTQCPQARC